MNMSSIEGISLFCQVVLFTPTLGAGKDAIAIGEEKSSARKIDKGQTLHIRQVSL